MKPKKNKELTLKQNQMLQDAIALHQSGRLDEAEKGYKKLLTLLPSHPVLLTNMGIIAHESGKYTEAIRYMDRALVIMPNQPIILYNQGLALQALKRLDEALEAYDKTIALNPYYADAYYNRGLVLQALKRFDEALMSCDKAIIFNPSHADAYYNRGIVLVELKRFKEAVASYDKVIALDPSYAEAYYNQAQVLTDLKQLDEAMAGYNQALSLKPDMDLLLGNILSIKMHLCIWDDFARQLTGLIQKIKNDEKVITPFSLLSLIDDPEIQRKTAEIYGKGKYPKSDTLPLIEKYPEHTKIRIGYFSADFKNHPVSFLTAELYERHDRNQFEIYAFSFGPDTNDEMNLRIKASVDHFYEVSTLSDKEVVILARNLEIDIAVDLGGYTADARTGLFAIRVAPVQLSYIGYLGTMAADYYDYLIADQTIIPETYQPYYSEKIVYLPSYQVNDSKQQLPTTRFTRQDFNLPETGFVFCCFNNTYKITPSTFDSWARILKQVEGSVLLLYIDNETAKNNLIKEIVFRGVGSNRLFFGKRLPMLDYLARYKVADLFLDTLPYNAGTTASDALRMGLPVLTCIGNSFASRVAASVLTAVNLPELITTTSAEYEALAIELATHPEKLKAIKEQLATNLLTAPLYDTPLFTRHIESAYTTMYKRYQNGLAPKGIIIFVCSRIF